MYKRESELSQSHIENDWVVNGILFNTIFKFQRADYFNVIIHQF